MTTQVHRVRSEQDAQLRSGPAGCLGRDASIHLDDGWTTHEDPVSAAAWFSASACRFGRWVLDLSASVRQAPGVKDLDLKRAQQVLDSILQHELAGVIRYTHYALMVTGPNRIPIVDFLKAQANESLLHAQQVGEILTGLEGHPSLSTSPMEETHRHAIKDVLEESLAHEQAATERYRELLDVVQDASIYLEEFARSMIGQEELHQIELRKMLRDFGE